MQTRSWGVSPGEETPAPGSAPQQCEPAGAERSLYSQQLWGCPPLPSPRNPASSRRAGHSCICKHGDVGPAPCSLFGAGGLALTAPPGTGLDPSGWEGSGRVWAGCGERTPERHRQRLGGKQTHAEMGGPGRALKRDQDPGDAQAECGRTREGARNQEKEIKETSQALDQQDGSWNGAHGDGEATTGEIPQWELLPGVCPAPHASFSSPTAPPPTTCLSPSLRASGAPPPHTC